MDERYFAYGSNLWIEQMVARTGPLRDGADRPRIARLADHRLAFNMHWDDGQVFANLAQPGNGVYGVVYTCSPKSLTRLEAFEAGYERGNVRVILEDGVPLNAFAYFAKAAYVGDDARPAVAYLQKILSGARQHGLPDAYIREIEAGAVANREG